MIVIRHLTKNESASLTNRGLGSVGIGARARSAFMFVPDPKDNTVKLMLHIKHNWSAEQPTPRFELRVATTKIGKGDDARPVAFALVDPLGHSPLTVADFTHKAKTDAGKVERARKALASMAVGSRVALEELLTKAACGRRTLEAAKGQLVAEGYSFAVHQTGNNKGGNERKSFWVLVAKPSRPVPDDPNVSDDDHDMDHTLEKELQLYRTPRHITEALLRREKFAGKVWEPCCGMGDMVAVIREHGYDDFWWSDIHDWGCPGTVVQDFRETNTRVGSIITNPPHDFPLEYVCPAKTLADKVAMLLSLNFEAAVGSADLRGDKEFPLKAVYTFTQSIRWLNVEKIFGKIKYAWFVWEKGYCGETKREWITFDPKTLIEIEASEGRTS